VQPAALRAELDRRGDGAPQEVRVIAPPPLSTLDWLTNDEDAERALSEQRAEAAAAAVEDAGASAERIPEVKEPNPLQAIEDALRLFPADEIVVATGAGENAEWLERGVFDDDLERFGIPVFHLVVRPV
jgi:hypothetical protein